MGTAKLWRASLGLALAAGIWGAMYVVSKIMLAVIPAWDLVWLRYLVGGPALALVMVGRRVAWRLAWEKWPIVVGVGLAGYVFSITAQFVGTAWANAQWGSVITSATPAFMALFSRWLVSERLTKRKLAAMLLATAGVWLIVGWGRIGPKFEAGGLVLVLAAVSWAFSSVLVKRIKPQDADVVTLYAMVLAALVMTPFALTTMPDGLWKMLLLPRNALGIFYLGVVSTAVAFWLWNRGLTVVPAATAGIYFFFQPIVGTVLGWWVLGEPITCHFVVGSGMILLGAMVALNEDRRQFA